MNFPWRHHSCLESNIKSVIKILLYFQVSEQRGSYTSILSIKTYIKHGCTYNMSRNSWITVDSSADQPAVRHVKTNDWTFLAAVCSSSSSVLLGFRKFLRLRLLTKCSHVVQILDESQISAQKKNTNSVPVRLQSQSVNVLQAQEVHHRPERLLTAAWCSWQETARFSPAASLSTTTRQSDPPPRWRPRHRNPARRLPPRWSRTAPSPEPRAPSVGQQRENKRPSTRDERLRNTTNCKSFSVYLWR